MSVASKLTLRDFYKSTKTGLEYIANRGVYVSKISDLPEEDKVFVNYVLDVVKRLEKVIQEKNNAIQG